jgi:hypothetical protein
MIFANFIGYRFDKYSMRFDGDQKVGRRTGFKPLIF